MTQRKAENPIAAIATSTAGDAALSVIRVSGEECHQLLNSCIQKNSERPDLAAWPAREVVLCDFSDSESGKILDVVTIVLYRAPASYTGEDAAEIFCHGGRALTRRIHSALLRAGFSAARAGDFTRRAFLNGKLDLAQAESVAAATQAASSAAALAATRGLTGETSRRIDAMSDRLADALSLLEANLDLSEEGINVVDSDRILADLQNAEQLVKELLRHAGRAELLSGAIRVALVGKPNVGKSTLLNRLLGSDRAIVSADPGTTRDVVDGRTEIGGILFEFLDTAGIRDSSHATETEGIRRSKAAADSAHIVLFVLDAGNVGADDVAVSKFIPETAQKIIVLNKTDMTDGNEENLLPFRSNGFSGATLVRTVGIRTDGVDGLFQALSLHGKSLAGIDSETPIWISARQAEVLRKAEQSLERARAAAQSRNLTEEFLAADVREALDALAEFSGRKTSDDILNRIFDQFCVGK